MKIKCGRRVFEVTSEDRILDNGATYQLITQTYNKDFCDLFPKISKSLFNKLKKDGVIRISAEKYKGYGSGILDLYEFVSEADKE